MRDSLGAVAYRNLANVVSVLGVLPLCLLFRDDGYRYLIPLIVYNNIMDDLDGILAAKLNIKSQFGGILDNVCDAVSHTLFVMIIGIQRSPEGLDSYLGTVCAAVSLAAAAAIVLRVVTRLKPESVAGSGSPTNELIRHLLFVLLLAEGFDFSPTPYLIATFTLHAVTMLVPLKMSWLIRNLTHSATAVGLVNIVLVAAWLWPVAAPAIAASFFATYLYSFAVGAVRWLNTHETDASI